MDLKKIDTVQFLLIVLLATFLFCVILSNQWKTINNKLIDLVEYQTRLIGQGYDPEAKITSTSSTYPSSTYSPATQKEIDKYAGYQKGVKINEK